MPATVHPGSASPGDGTHPDDLPYAQAWADAMVVTPTGWYVDAELFRVRFAALREAALREAALREAALREAALLTPDDGISDPASGEQKEYTT